MPAARCGEAPIAPEGASPLPVGRGGGDGEKHTRYAPREPLRVAPQRRVRIGRAAVDRIVSIGPTARGLSQSGQKRERNGVHRIPPAGEQRWGRTVEQRRQRVRRLPRQEWGKRKGILLFRRRHCSVEVR